MTSDRQRVLVLGATGMLGHRLCASWADRFDTYGTVRLPEGASRLPSWVIDPAKVVMGVSAHDESSVRRALDVVKPSVVVNAIGLVKQRRQADEQRACVEVNALFPHVVADACARSGARLVHISTDCVFTGSRGRYTEHDVADADDDYGRSKRLGEVNAEHCITLRMSLIGRELSGSAGLVEWFFDQLRNDAPIPGFTKAVFSGLGAPTAADAIGHVIEHHHTMHGTWHVAAEPISKYEMLRQLSEAIEQQVTLRPESSPVVDRSLDGSAFRRRTNWQAPTWSEMLATIARHAATYDQIRVQPT